MRARWRDAAASRRGADARPSMPLGATSPTTDLPRHVGCHHGPQHVVRSLHEIGSGEGEFNLFHVSLGLFAILSVSTNAKRRPLEHPTAAADTWLCRNGGAQHGKVPTGCELADRDEFLVGGGRWASDPLTAFLTGTRDSRRFRKPSDSGHKASDLTRVDAIGISVRAGEYASSVKTSVTPIAASLPPRPPAEGSQEEHHTDER